MRITRKFTALVATVAAVLAGLLVAGPAAVATPSGPWTSAVIDLSAAAQGLDSVSCPTSSFCMAVDRQGNAFTFDQGSWSAAQALFPAFGNVPLTSVSCPSSSFCAVATSNGYALLGNTHTDTWQPFYLWTDEPNPAPLTSVSCMSSTVCLAGDINGNIYIWDPAAPNWASSGANFLATPGGYDPVVSISCTATYCMALSGSGSYVEYSGGTFTSPAAISGGVLNGATAVSCNASDMCVAGASQNGFGYYSVFAGGTWSPVALCRFPTVAALRRWLVRRRPCASPVTPPATSWTL